MEYNNHEYILISVEITNKNKNSCVITLEWALYIHIETGAPSL